MNPRLLGAVPLVLFVLMAPLAKADWKGFYTPTEKPKKAAAQSVCIREILQAQARHEIPGNLLLGIGLQEAGLRRDGDLTVWPWTANAEGEGRFFDSPEAAEDWVRSRLNAGIASVDVGCMQVNLRWHPEAFASLDEGFDPAKNVDYAARLLKKLYQKTGDWGTAAGAYHSQTPEYQEAYLSRLSRNVEVANAQIDGFVDIAKRSGPVKRSAPAVTETGGVFWTAWLGDGGEGGARSLYGSGPIEPILPAFRAVPGAEG